MSVYNKRGILLLPKVIVLNPKDGRDHIRMRVWERGSGETWACGTGATASAMAAILRGFTDDEVRVSLRGGDLLIRFDRESNHLFMTGPAKEVFHGSIDIPEEIYYLSFGVELKK